MVKHAQTNCMDSPGGGNGLAVVVEWQVHDTFHIGPKSMACCNSIIQVMAF